MRPNLLFAELAGLGRMKITTQAVEVPDIRELDPAVCHLSWQIELEKAAGRDAIDEVFIFATDCYLDIRQTGAEPAVPEAGPGFVAPAAAEKPELAKSLQNKADSVRVQSHRLDDLMDQLGELVIAQARLNRISAELGDSGPPARPR